ncbi:MAG: Putative racemase YgeA [Candidatus Erwinia impunctatus]|nr:Putative racemase YgeA [Culicoides impunctatus]
MLSEITTPLNGAIIMKTIGLLGGMSWESTLSYYKAINEGVRQQLGGLSSAKIILNSVDFAEIETRQHAGDWPATAQILMQAAQAVERAGADFLLICINTMHKVEPQISGSIAIPVVHIADATALRLREDGITRVRLLGTRFTMEEDFYTSRLTEKFDLQVVTPDQEARNQVHQIIYNELCQGIVREKFRQIYQQSLTLCKRKDARL